MVMSLVMRFVISLVMSDWTFFTPHGDPFMATMSSISPTSAAPTPPTRSASVDSDGDTDGTKAKAPPAPAPVVQAQVSNPTATTGNSVNTYA